MPVALYMDVNVHGQITFQLRRRGIDILTAQEDQMRAAADSQLLDRATELNRIIVSSDKDFLIETAHRQQVEIYFPGLFHLSGRKIPIGKFVADLEFLAKAGETEDFANQIYYLPL